MTLDEYFHELCTLVLARDTDVSYEELMRILFDREFRWTHPMDVNRAHDGLAIRSVYLDHYNVPCNWLEALIGIAQRMEFIQGGELSYWFWEMIQNLRLDRKTDSKFRRGYGRQRYLVLHRLESVETLIYEYNGDGGIFPLKNPREDQRNVEIWYQMQAWLAENYDVV